MIMCSTLVEVVFLLGILSLTSRLLAGSAAVVAATTEFGSESAEFIHIESMIMYND